MQRRHLAQVCILIGALAAGCSQDQGSSAAVHVSHEDGVYRGVFIDRNEIQVGIEFALKDNLVTKIGFRHLQAQGHDYRNAEDGSREALLRAEYEKLIEHLVGKDIRQHLSDLYKPERIAEDVDGLTAATMRSSKMISAIRDGLGRGVYSYSLDD